ncbi:MAG: hypothetical protein ACI8PT_003559 [Gammaproteobacteria bacterium]
MLLGSNHTQTLWSAQIVRGTTLFREHFGGTQENFGRRSRRRGDIERQIDVFSNSYPIVDSTILN